jgi:hypothetical protein
MIELDKETLQKAVNKWGVNIQQDMIIEEMSELIKEICKSKRGKENRIEIVEELTDVLIMLEQLKFMYNISDEEINGFAKVKIYKLKERL